MRCFLLCLAFGACVSVVRAEETRAGKIEQARDEKESTLKPNEMPRAESRLLNVQSKWLDPVFGQSDGLHLRVGGLATGSGFAMGTEYVKTDIFGGNMTFRAGATGSVKGWYEGTVDTSLPRLWNGRAFVDLSLAHRDYSSIDYYGPGADSRKSGRSDFRFEATTVEVRPGIRPFRGLRAGLIGGLLAANVGPGTEDRFISSEQQFGPGVAPGIDHQTSFWRGGGFVEFDWRNYPGDTTRGGLYSAQYVHNSDRSLGLFNFGRLDLEARQYIPFLNGKRVIALRGVSSLTTTSGDQQVPFYMQPTLGGPTDLRGFRAYRFYGDNMVATSAEYRWEASTALGMALFVDAGKVFDRWSQWNFHNLEASYGFGFRFKSQHTPLFRIDTGFSHEGFQIWFRFNDAF